MTHSNRAEAPKPMRVHAIHPDVQAAETYAVRQRRAGLHLLTADRRIAHNPADIAMCERVVAAAKNDPGEFEHLITFPEVNALFCRGALYFSRGK